MREAYPLIGKIAPQYSVFCARCAKPEYLGNHDLTRSEAAKLAKEMGYRYIRGEGWVCPKCLKDEQKLR